MKIYKEPKYENDSYMFVIEEIDMLAVLNRKIYSNDYINCKVDAFRRKDISKESFEQFRMRPSLRMIDSYSDLAGTIYTHTCEGKNKLDYKHIIKYCKKYYKDTRKCAINFADTLSDYLRSDKNSSCLNSIHYCGDNVTLYFRASDIKNELLLDLYLINEFFIKPVGNFKTITVMASTAQNVETKLSTLIQ